jgi:hypothetical protein
MRIMLEYIIVLYQFTYNWKLYPMVQKILLKHNIDAEEWQEEDNFKNFSQKNINEPRFNIIYNTSGWVAAKEAKDNAIERDPMQADNIWTNPMLKIKFERYGYLKATVGLKKWCFMF